MRRFASRWLLVSGLIAAMGGCRQVDRPPVAPPTTPAIPEPMPSIPLETVAPAPAPPAPKQVVRRPKRDRPQVMQVEYRAAPSPSLAHAPDHSWLVGRLERDEAKGRWYIRFAGPDERDSFGGRMELIRTGPMTGFHAGQAVRAEGRLVDPAPLETQPAYRVRSLQAIGAEGP